MAQFCSYMGCWPTAGLGAVPLDINYQAAQNYNKNACKKYSWNGTTTFTSGAPFVAWTPGKSWADGFGDNPGCGAYEAAVCIALYQQANGLEVDGKMGPWTTDYVRSDAGLQPKYTNSKVEKKNGVRKLVPVEPLVASITGTATNWLLYLGIAVVGAGAWLAFKRGNR